MVPVYLSISTLSTPPPGMWSAGVDSSRISELSQGRGGLSAYLYKLHDTWIYITPCYTLMRKKPMKILDLFCGAGGAAMGLHRAFPDAEIVGVDINPQPRYPFEFIQDDALSFPLQGFDFIWASPPCQVHSALSHLANPKHEDLILQTRARLIKSGTEYVIENVPLAPLVDPIMLCGTMFGLKTGDAQLRRHRIFETSFDCFLTPNCSHNGRTIGIFGDKARDTAAEKRHYTKPKNTRGKPPPGILFKKEEAFEAMGINWMNMKELSQAVPPAYSEYIGNEYNKLIHKDC